MVPLIRSTWILAAVLAGGALAAMRHADSLRVALRPSPAGEPSDAGAGWWQAATARLAREEYRATPDPDGLQAPNRAHNLRTRFREGGIEIVPREAGGPDWRFAWETSGFGREGMMQAVDVVAPERDGTRVTYRRPGLDEWYENSPAGLEQGFTLHSSPPGLGALCLAGRLAESLRAELVARGDAVDLLDLHGARVLRYGELHVRDARGHELPSRLRLAGTELAILIDDDGARYPLTVDPLMTSPAWTVESDQAGARLGWSVATAGDVNGDGYSDVIVGAERYDNGQTDEGRAFVYLGSAAGLSTTAAWSAEGDQASASFGASVATAGDVNGDGYSDVIVGAPLYDAGQVDEGRVFVYLGSAAGLQTTAAWTAESDQPGASFGFSVASAGDVNGDGYSDVIVGADQYDNPQPDEGRTFVYHGSAAGLATTADWSVESDQFFGHLGYSVATAGDVNGDGYSDVIVGAYGYDNGETDEGGAFVYLGSAAGLATTAAWTGEGNQASAAFGGSVATAGDVNGDGFADVIVGADFYDNGQVNEGRAFVYYGSAGGLAATAIWTVEGNQTGAQLGASVATAGDVNGDGFADVIVGSYLYDAAWTNEGRAFVYQGSAIGLGGIAWSDEGGQAGAQFGHCVATAGDVNGDGLSDVIVGAFAYDNGQGQAGRAFVYHGSTAGLWTGYWLAEGDQAGAQMGYSVATAGDVNGDGYSDLIVGAPLFDNGETDEGRVFVYHGSAAGPSYTADWTAEGDQADAGFGFSVATAGDVNGDGYADVIVGAASFDGGYTNEGRALVYHGSASGLSPTAAWTAEGDQIHAHFGSSVATAGDVNGDGYADVIIGAHFYDNGQLDEGRAFVYHGSPAGLAGTAAWTAEGDQDVANFGISVATAGDVNGDGYSDVIVGAWYYDNTLTNEGQAFVYHGSGSGLGTSPAWTVAGGQPYAELGVSVATAGDVNGDGYSDVIIGAQSYDSGETDEGRALVFHGSATGLSTVEAWHADSDQADAYLGHSVSTAGDVNGDGYSDVIVGAYSYDLVFTDEGRAWVYHGSASGLAQVDAWTDGAFLPSSFFGISVATAGDVNGDGYSEVIVGAHFYDSGQTDEGQVFVYPGNGGWGRATSARAMRTDDTAPIAFLGQSDSDTEFGIRAVLPSIFGRTRLEMEHEVKPLGTSFDGTSTVAGAFLDTGANGERQFDHLVSGLAPGTPYHWRVRARYDLTASPFQRNGPWMHVPVNGWNEAGLRTAGGPVGVPAYGVTPAAGARFEILAGGSNPARGPCEVILALGRPARVDVDVLDVTGRRVAVLAENRSYDAGPHRIAWDGRDRSGAAAVAGVYFLRARSQGETRVRKAILIR